MVRERWDGMRWICIKWVPWWLMLSACQWHQRAFSVAATDSFGEPDDWQLLLLRLIVLCIFSIKGEKVVCQWFTSGYICQLVYVGYVPPVILKLTPMLVTHLLLVISLVFQQDQWIFTIGGVNSWGFLICFDVAYTSVPQKSYQIPNGSLQEQMQKENG